MKGWYWTPAQSRVLEAALSRTHDAGLFRRLLALWHVERGQPVDEVAKWLRVDRSSIYRWMERFAATGQPEALADQRGQMHYSVWDEDCQGLLESAMLYRPRDLGYPANQWTAPALQDFVAACRCECEFCLETVRRGLKALGYVWKRFRYVLPPDPEAEKKTSDSAPDPGFAAPNGPVGRGRNRSSALAGIARWLGFARPTRSGSHLGAERSPNGVRRFAPAHRAPVVSGSEAQAGVGISRVPGLHPWALSQPPGGTPAG
jgi:transposase